MKYLIIGDGHLQPSNLNRVKDFWFAVRQYALENNLKMILLGDNYHTNQIVQAEVHEFWFNYFKDRSNFIDSPIVLVGNHSMQNQVVRARDTATPERTLPNIVCIDRLTELNNLSCIPYCHDRDMFLEEIKEAKGRFLISHQEYKGFTYETGILTNDDSPSYHDVEKFDLVINGHLHKHQIKYNIHCIGAPYHLRKSDINNPRHVGIFDSETGKLEYLTDFEHLAPKIELIEQPKNIHITPIKQDTRNLTLDELLLDIIDKKYENRDYGKQILESAREYLRTTA